jgi:8-oxo-dGTP pyrophosphatase MutT (NUDIX family)
MKEELKKALEAREKLCIDDCSLTSAAVLIPVFRHDGEHRLLFTRRTEHLRAHKGQISFPGGTWEETDESLLDTALRECTEEIGLSPQVVEVLGELDDSPTMYTNFCIRPFVGVIPWPLELKVDPFEVAEIITVPVSALLEKGALRQENDPANNGTAEGSFYYYDNKIIWGATARILTQFLEIWSKLANDGSR